MGLFRKWFFLVVILVCVLGLSGNTSTLVSKTNTEESLSTMISSNDAIRPVSDYAVAYSNQVPPSTMSMSESSVTEGRHEYYTQSTVFFVSEERLERSLDDLPQSIIVSTPNLHGNGIAEGTLHFIKAENIESIGPSAWNVTYGGQMVWYD